MTSSGVNCTQTYGRRSPVSRQATTLPTPMMTAGQSTRRATRSPKGMASTAASRPMKPTVIGRRSQSKRVVSRRAVIPGRADADQRDAGEGDDPGGTRRQRGPAHRAPQAEQAGDEEHEVRQDVPALATAERPASANAW